jgi:hypothetical protein
MSSAICVYLTGSAANNNGACIDHRSTHGHCAVKIFWSWQSDTPRKTGRHVVRGVLQDVVDEIKQSIEV